MDIKLTHIPTNQVWHLTSSSEMVKLLDRRDPERADRDNYSAHVTY